MRIDLRRMPMPELLQLLKDLANELQSRGRGGGTFGGRGGQPNGNYIGHGGHAGYGTPYGGGYGQNPGYGNSRFGGGGNFTPRGGKGGGGHRKGRRQEFRQRQPMEPPAPIDDRPSLGADSDAPGQV